MRTCATLLTLLSFCWQQAHCGCDFSARCGAAGESCEQAELHVHSCQHHDGDRFHADCDHQEECADASEITEPPLPSHQHHLCVGTHIFYVPPDSVTEMGWSQVGCMVSSAEEHVPPLLSFMNSSSVRRIAAGWWGIPDQSRLCNYVI